MKTKIWSGCLKGVTYIGKHRIVAHIPEGFYATKRVGQTMFICGVNIKWIVSVQDMREAGMKV